MAIDRVSSQGRVRIQDEILRSKQNQGSANRSDASQAQRGNSDSERARGRDRAPGQRKRIQDEILNPTPPATVTPAPAEPTPVATIPENDARTLAERYVSQYEQQTGRTLSSEERTQKIQEVEDFYGEAQRSGRLNSIVFA